MSKLSTCLRCQFENDQASACNGSFTRRQWLGRVPPSALAALLASGFAGEPGSTSEQVKSDPGADDFGAHVYNVRQYGAKGDGTTLDTAAVQAAIDACHRNGGGIVLIPAGTFQIGTVELKSHVTLHIAAAGKLLGSAGGKQYHAVDAIPLTGDSTLNDGNCALLFAVKQPMSPSRAPARSMAKAPSFTLLSAELPLQADWEATAVPTTVSDIALVDSAQLVGSFLRRHFGVY